MRFVEYNCTFGLAEIGKFALKKHKRMDGSPKMGVGLR